MIQCEQVGNVLCIQIIDPFDTKDAKAIHDNPDLESAQAVLMDMEMLGMMDSSVLAIMVTLYRRLSESGKGFGLYNMTEFGREVISMSGLSKIIAIHESKEAGLAALSS